MAARPGASQPPGPAGSPQQLPGKARDAHRFDPDGHTWKKYGHKILSSEGLKRYYYACTGKEKHGCPAKKMVDRERFQRQRTRDITKDTVVYEGAHNHPPELRALAEPDEAEQDDDAEGKTEGATATGGVAGGSEGGRPGRVQTPNQWRRKFPEILDRGMASSQSEGSLDDAPKKIRQEAEPPLSGPQPSYLQPSGPRRCSPAPCLVSQPEAVSVGLPALGGGQALAASSQRQYAPGAAVPSHLQGTGQPSLPQRGIEPIGMGLHQGLPQPGGRTLGSAWLPAAPVGQASPKAETGEGMALLQGNFSGSQLEPSGHGAPQIGGSWQPWHPQGQQIPVGQPFPATPSGHPQHQPTPRQIPSPASTYGDRSLPVGVASHPGAAAVQSGAPIAPVPRQIAMPTQASQDWGVQYAGLQGQAQSIERALQGLAQSFHSVGSHQQRTHQQQMPLQQPHREQQGYPEPQNEAQPVPWHPGPQAGLPLAGPGPNQGSTQQGSMLQGEQLQHMRGQWGAENQLQASAQAHSMRSSGWEQSFYAQPGPAKVEPGAWAQQAPAGMRHAQAQPSPPLQPPNAAGMLAPLPPLARPGSMAQPAGMGQPLSRPLQGYVTPSTDMSRPLGNSAPTTMPSPAKVLLQAIMHANVHQTSRAPQPMLTATGPSLPPPTLQPSIPGQLPPNPNQLQSAGGSAAYIPSGTQDQIRQVWHGSVGQPPSAFSPIAPGSLVRREPLWQQPGAGVSATIGEPSQSTPRAAARQPVHAQAQVPIGSTRPGPSSVTASRSFHAGMPTERPMLPYSRSFSYGGTTAGIGPKMEPTVLGDLKSLCSLQTEVAGGLRLVRSAQDAANVPAAGGSADSQTFAGVQQGIAEVQQHARVLTEALPGPMDGCTQPEGHESEPRASQGSGPAMESSDAGHGQQGPWGDPRMLDELMATASLGDGGEAGGIQDVLEDGTQAVSRQSSKDDYEALLEYLTSKK